MIHTSSYIPYRMLHPPRTDCSIPLQVAVYSHPIGCYRPTGVLHHLQDDSYRVQCTVRSISNRVLPGMLLPDVTVYLPESSI